MNVSRQESRDQLLGRTSEGLSSFFREFARNPFSHFYEEDVRSHLFVHLDRLINVISEFPIDNRFLRSINPPLMSSIVKAEYPHSGEISRFDIAVLEPGLSTDFYAAPVSLAIEVKVGFPEPEPDRTASFKGDIYKLVAAKQYAQSVGLPFLGIAVYFQQTPIKDDVKFRSFYVDTFKNFRKVAISEIQLIDNTVTGFVIAPGTDESAYAGNDLSIDLNAANAS